MLFTVRAARHVAPASRFQPRRNQAGRRCQLQPRSAPCEYRDDATALVICARWASVKLANCATVRA
jgi:hypothetical protein